VDRRVALPGPRTIASWLGLRRGTALPERLARLSSDDSQLRTLVAHVAALAAAVTAFAIQGPGPLGPQDALTGVAVAVAFSGLHVATVRRRLVTSTLVLDATGMAVFTAGTGAPQSPFFLMALAGVWWAAHVPRRRSAAIYAGAFLAVYAVLVVPGAVRERQMVQALEDVSVLVVVALLSGWFVRVGRRAIELSSALRRPPFGPEELEIREGLGRALGTIDVPVDVVLSAAQLGLTAAQAELLAYLVLGLSNAEIADASGLSEATVRYRLTRLYRALSVRGRREAAGRAHELGLAGQGDRRVPAS
jgi:DNA-binding CsgD family transcriptional regulator